MKTVIFYNEKGGVGKSSFTIMYASYLKYKYGVKVGVADYNFRINNYRQDEKAVRKNAGTYDLVKDKELWPIVTAMPKDINTFPKAILHKYCFWLQNQIDNGQLKGLDVILIDLPGSVAGGELRELLINHMISLCVIPTDRDAQTMRAAIETYNRVAGSGKVPSMVFINQVQSFVKFKEYEDIARELPQLDPPVKVLPDIISFSERMRKMTEVDLMRSTFEYPDWESKAFEGSKDLGIENLFIDVTRELVKVKDLKGTEPCELSFVKDLKKEFQERRQLFGTAFPEYEFDKSMFSKDRQKSADEK